ncbi:MAG: DUF2480 family protein [Balneolaceae bacterium]
MSEIVNKVKQSKLVTIDLEKLIEGERVEEIDLKQFLFQGLILKEKEFRDQLTEFDWKSYTGANIALFCSADAIIPSWAWMLVTTCLQPYAKEIVYGNRDELRKELLYRKISENDWNVYRDKFVLMKGCSKAKVPEGAYLEATKKLLPVAGKIMYGEACSNVPVYKKPREARP